ncbi:brain-specific angiogenesis inhibitor 1-associated protein 2-like protein 1b isoform X1 [Ictalurus punctatus]|uniref:BAR/IMD domain-containing adapter protein 2-like 1 n=1 Tax=Ictalurus punctatus TaxID=7998 RepID=A0A2D0SP87_ICTPU|nr:brain-specific angiogenesis inhibitor 1-associated protein 2-like protein 1b isoform X1 [Ictalurus punctatus]
MSRDPEEVNKLTESTYKNVMEQFNPGLKNLVNLGKSYEKAVMAMTLAGKMYFEAVGKIGENAAVSPVSRELGVVLSELSEAHRKVLLELEENFRRFHREIIAELDKKTDMDMKYMTATFKKYQMEHKMKQDFLERSQADLKKLRRKSQGKNALKYESKENECLETLTHRQMDMQKFIADGCKEALLEEKRRFCFLVDKHCTFSYQLAGFHEKAKDILIDQIPNWQDKCSDITNVPDSVMSMIEGLRTPVSITPQASPAIKRHSRNNSDAMIPPPAPPLKAQTSPLVSLFNQDTAKQETVTDNSNDGSQMVRSISMATGLNNMSQRPRVRTIFPHKSGNNNTLLSFDEGDLIILLIPDERDGWLYGELEKTKQRGWFPSSYCRPYVEPVVNNRHPMYTGQNVFGNPPARSKSVANLTQPDPEDDVMLPPPDYSDTPVRRNSTKSLIQTHVPSSENTVSQPNGISKPPFLVGTNPFATVKLRPTVTNDRSAPRV